MNGLERVMLALTGIINKKQRVIFENKKEKEKQLGVKLPPMFATVEQIGLREALSYLLQAKCYLELAESVLEKHKEDLDNIDPELKDVLNDVRVLQYAKPPESIKGVMESVPYKIVKDGEEK